MKRYEVSREVAASADTAWRVMSDLPRWPEWTASIAEIRVEGAAPPGVGTRVWISQPKLPPNTWTITRWEPGRVFAWEMRSGGVHCVGVHEVIARGTGCTVRLELTFGGVIGHLLGVLGRSITEQYMAFEADGLKARSEGTR
ncbi:MAG: SRPBCC family protein [Gemmatimonadetes bacterium]|nr:SRPBCC family protein [Gemmatimonadota bacterium]